MGFALAGGPAVWTLDGGRLPCACGGGGAGVPPVVPRKSAVTPMPITTTAVTKEEATALSHGCLISVSKR